MRLLLYISLLLLMACKNQIDIDTIEQREHDLNYIKGTNTLVDGEVIRKFDNGRVAERISYKKGQAIGPWYAYGYDGEIVNHGFGVNAKNYERKLSNLDLSYSVLTINIEGDLTFATLYIDDRKLFDNPQPLILLAKEIFVDYGIKYKLNDILIYDSEHEYTIYKSATLNMVHNFYKITGKNKKTILIK